MGLMGESQILAAGRQVLDGMKLTVGEGAPEAGDLFAEAATRMGDAASAFRGALPDESWNGGASAAYADKVSGQFTRAESVAAADRLVSAVLARQSVQVSAVRRNLDRHSDWLTQMGQVAIMSAVRPLVGTAAVVATEIAVVTRALEASTDELTALQRDVHDNANELHEAVQKYASVDEAGKPPGDGDVRSEGESPRQPVAPVATSAVPGGVPSAASETDRAAPAGGFPAAGGDVAGMVAGLVGAIVSPLGAIFGGLAQAAAGAVQAAAGAVQSGIQAVTAAGEPVDLDPEDRDDKDDDKDESSDDPESKERDARERSGDGRHADAPHAGHVEAGGAAATPHGASVQPPAVESPPAKTLPPELSSAAGPTRFEQDSDRRPRSVPATARLDATNPGSAAVTWT